MIVAFILCLAIGLFSLILKIAFKMSVAMAGLLISIFKGSAALAFILLVLMIVGIGF